MAASNVFGIVGTIKENESLQQYLLANVIPTGKKLGQGQYGTNLQQVKYRHIKCTGKTLDGFSNAEHDMSTLQQRCHTLSCLRHPNITQFLGISFIGGEELPLLIMERLEMTLEDVLQNAPNIPLPLKINFMEDICSGLVYLHHLKPGIIHRELRAFNVFVTSTLVAKISSMGTGLLSKLVAKQRLVVGGTLPKKAVASSSTGASGNGACSGASVDVWSFGILSEYILTQICPDGIHNNPISDNKTSRRVSFDLEDNSQEECLSKLQAQLGSYPSLVQLVRGCLHVSPAQRPSSEEALFEVQRVRVEVERVYGASGTRHLDLQKVWMAKELKMSEKRIKELEIYQRRLEADHRMQQRQVDDQLLDLAHNDKQLRDLRDAVNAKDAKIDRMDKELVKYQEEMELVKAGKLNISEDEDFSLLADETYSFEQEVVGSLKKSGSTSSVEVLDGKTPENLMSPKRRISGSIKKMIRRTTTTSTSSDASNPHSPASRSSDYKRRWSTSSDKENYSPTAVHDSPTRMAGVAKQPPRGEKRYVYLNTKSGKYGFRLQSYGRVREQGKVMQTFVQSVAAGSPAFMAGLYPGDAIVEVNGVDVKYSPMDSIVDAIRKEALKGDRVLLKVVYADGVTRVDCMKKADDLKTEMKKKQGRLKELINVEEQYLPPPAEVRISSPLHIVAASDVPVWEESLPNFEATEHTFRYNRMLNQLVGIHRDNITSLDCDALVMPLSSCQKMKEDGSKNLLLQLLKTGGSRLLDQLSMARHCKIGSNIITEGHGIRAKYIYHCVFGDLEESLQNCCYKALETASEEKLSTVVFWLDGFAFLSVSPQLIIESVRCWLQQDISQNTFRRVIFSSKANADLVEQIMRKTFPLYPSASSNRESFTSSVDVYSLDSETKLTNGTTDSDISKRDSVFSEEGEQKGDRTEKPLSEPS